MAEWNAYYRNENDEEGQDEGEEAAGETRAAVASSSFCLSDTCVRVHI